MVYRVNDPELRAKVETLKSAGVAYTNQDDLRLHWLERELEHLGD
jgi:hypothetical protein